MTNITEGSIDYQRDWESQGEFIILGFDETPLLEELVVTITRLKTLIATKYHDTPPERVTVSVGSEGVVELVPEWRYRFTANEWVRYPEEAE